MSLPHTESDLSRIYAQRFASNLDYRKRVWRVLIDSFFRKYVPEDANVLDLGCGYGEFINQVRAAGKYAMDLNPDASRYLSAEVEFIQQDCSQPWRVAEGSLDVVMTSNFFEHLPSKTALGNALDQAKLALKGGAHLVAMGPNARLLPGAYWDFWDHYLPLTERSLCEALENRGFDITRKTPAFLPYKMAGNVRFPPVFIKLYLAMPVFWPLLGKQFLVVARKP